MNSKNIKQRMDRARDDLSEIMEDLETTRSEFVDPVCWNCGKAHKIYLPGSYTPVYKPCEIWREDKKCAFEPRER